MASSGYRRLLKSAKELFKADNFALKSAKSELRSQFYKNKDIKDPIELSKNYFHHFNLKLTLNLHLQKPFLMV